MLELQDEVERLRTRIGALEREVKTEVQRVHKEYKREIVLYSDASKSRLPVRRKV